MKTTPEQLASQNGLYIEALCDISPDILSASCKHIVKTCEAFPKPASIRKVAREIAEDRHASRALANPDRSQPENFLARVKRVSNRDADWLRAHHGLLEQAIADHYDGILGDAHLMDSLERAAHGLAANRQPLPAVARAAE